jgi:hypothetical protein
MHTETLDFTPVARQSKDADAMELLNKPLRFFFLIFAMFGQSVLIKVLDSAKDDTASESFKISIYTQAATLLAITYLIFGNWKNFKCGPGFAYGLAYTVLVGFPIFNLLKMLINWKNVDDSVYKAYIIFCTAAGIGLMANFFIIRNKVVNRVTSEIMAKEQKEEEE